MKTAIYVNEKSNHNEQLTSLKDYANKHGYENIEIYADYGYSANDLNRPDLNRLIEDIKFGRINTILIDGYSRLTRNVSDLNLLFNTVFTPNKVNVISIN